MEPMGSVTYRNLQEGKESLLPSGNKKCFGFMGLGSRGSGFMGLGVLGFRGLRLMLLRGLGL